MISDCETCPVVDQVGFQLQYVQSGLYMSRVVPDLDLHRCDILEQGDVIGFEPVGVLEAFGRFEVIFFLFVDRAHCVPAEHAFHLALHQGHFRSLKSLVFLSQPQLKQSLHGDGFGVVGVGF